MLNAFKSRWGYDSIDLRDRFGSSNGTVCLVSAVMGPGEFRGKMFVIMESVQVHTGGLDSGLRTWGSSIGVMHSSLCPFLSGTRESDGTVTGTEIPMLRHLLRVWFFLLSAGQETRAFRHCSRSWQRCSRLSMYCFAEPLLNKIFLQSASTFLQLLH